MGNFVNTDILEQGLDYIKDFGDEIHLTTAPVVTYAEVLEYSGGSATLSPTDYTKDLSPVGIDGVLITCATPAIVPNANLDDVSTLSIIDTVNEELVAQYQFPMLPTLTSGVSFSPPDLTFILYTPVLGL